MEDTKTRISQMVRLSDARARAQEKKAGAPDAETALYVWRANLFGASGRWPLPKDERRRLYEKLGYNAKRDWGMVDRPPQPPQELTAAQVQTINRQLEKHNWTIVRARRRWALMQMI